MKKIMFNDKYGLTDAVLEERKTMTRRMVSVPEYWHGMWVWGFAFDKQSHSLRLYDADEGPMEDPETGECAYTFPKYKIGEVVAVAQSYNVLDYGFHGFATNPSRSCGIRKEYAEKQKGWGNKMFVESKLMPHQIRITDIKVERLQEISDEDCVKEGVRYFLDYGQERIARFYIDTIPNYRPGEMITYDCAKEAFAALIDKVSSKGIWETNPWVFAYSFELVK